MSSLLGELPFGIGVRFVLCHFKGHINSGEVKGRPILTKHVKNHFLEELSESEKS